MELRDPIFGVVKELFDLPLEIKARNLDSAFSKGYIPNYPGTSLLEGQDIDGAEKLEACEKFTALCDSHTESTTYTLRILKYKKLGENEGGINPLPHTDKSFLSILYQNSLRGLEVMTKDIEWAAFEPSPSSFMVMAGDASVGWSNGRIKAYYHRINVKEDKLMRYSLGVFSYNTGKIEVPEELIDKDHPPQFKSFNHLDFLRFYKGHQGRPKSERLITAYCGV
ncbi:hypothetical protein NL676_026823 [Syzygium grande]|nr:hypothetical protein NL676_026823 [Syzygium grande]